MVCQLLRREQLATRKIVINGELFLYCETHFQDERAARMTLGLEALPEVT